MPQFVLADPAKISARTFDDEIVAAHFSTGVYYSFRGSAAEVWYGLMAGVPSERVAQLVGAHSRLAAQDFEREALAFVAALENERLIKPTTVAQDPSWQPRPPAQPFDAPVYERFTDMEELLLLDPVHDVGMTGLSEPGDPLMAKTG
jgi:hypothetical protein